MITGLAPDQVVDKEDTIRRPAQAATGRIQVADLRKTYELSPGRTIKALDGMSLSVRDREFAVLVGPSGCGKSTLLRIIAGLEVPDRGIACVRGKAVDSPEPSVGIVFQAFTSFPWLTVLENIEFGLRVRGVLPAPRRVVAHRFVDLVRLVGFESAYPHQLSGGMRQRVAIARTLAVEPDVLLLDEPFGALDSQTRSIMQELLLEIWEANARTVLFVTHDVDEAIFLADRICISSARPGRLICEVQNTLPRPRTFAMRSTQQFAEMKDRILHLVRDEAIRAAEVTP